MSPSEPLACPDCGATEGLSGQPFMTNQALAVHRAKAHGWKPPNKETCKFCGKEYAKKFYLTHLKKVHGVTSRMAAPPGRAAQWAAAEAVLDEPQDPLADLRLEAEAIGAIADVLTKLSRPSQERVMLQLESHFQLFGGRKR